MNKSYSYYIFALREYLTAHSGSHYPTEIISLVMEPIVRTSCILEITTSRVRILKAIFNMIQNISEFCCIKIISRKGIYIRRLSDHKVMLYELDLTSDYFDT